MKTFLNILYKVVIRLITFLPFLILIGISLVRHTFWYVRNFILYGFELGIYDKKVNPATIGMVYEKLLEQDKI